MDIRNFFGPKAGGKGSASKAAPKPQEETKKKKRVQVLSDSDSEEEVKKPKVAAKPTKSKGEEKVPAKSKLKEVNPSDFFNSKAGTSNPVKRKSSEKDKEKDGKR